MATLLNGKKLAIELKKELAIRVQKETDAGKRKPHLSAILVGDDGASTTYVNSKERDCEKVGFTSTVHRLPASTSEKELLELIDSINNNSEIDGLIVQLPLPKQINATAVTEAIDPRIDVDGFHTVSVGKLTKGEDTYISATPFGIIMLLEKYNIETSGKHCVVIGRSNIVGRPMSILMSRNGNPGNSTVTICHSRTQNIEKFTKDADIVIVALGIPEFLKADMVKPGAIVIDVGITRVEANNEKGYVLKGDVEFEGLEQKCEAITPVPGGVGPMTRYGLLFNTFKSYLKSNI